MTSFLLLSLCISQPLFALGKKVQIGFLYSKDLYGKKNLEIMKEKSMLTIRKEARSLKLEQEKAYKKADKAYKDKMKNDVFFREREKKKETEAIAKKKAEEKEKLLDKERMESKDVKIRAIMTSVAGDRGNFSPEDFGKRKVSKPEKPETILSKIFKLDEGEADQLISRLEALNKGASIPEDEKHKEIFSAYIELNNKL